MWRMMVVAALVLMIGSGCAALMPEVAKQKARTEAELAEAERVAAEAQADRTRIEAEAEREAARIAAQADAEAQQAIAKARLQDAQNAHLQALAESTRASGEREIMESVARQIDANSENIRAQTGVVYAEAKRIVAESWAVYGLIAVAGILVLGFAGWLILSGIAKVRSAGALPAPRRSRVIDVPQRRQRSIDWDAVGDAQGKIGKLVAASYAIANRLERNGR